MQLLPQVPSGYSLVCFDEIDSTNAEALRCSEKGQQDRLWIVAERQIHGRGRRGRKWITEPGNLFATLLLNWPGPVSKLSQLSFVAAVTVADMIEKLLAQSPSRSKVRLKWPNDILLNGAKIGGILIETSSTGVQSTAIAIGIGINVANHPTQALAYPTTDLNEHGLSHSCSEIFEKLAISFDHYLALWQSGDGFALIKQRWLDFGPAIGQELRINTGTDVVTGNFAGLDQHGGLQLRMADGSQQVILAGDVVASVGIENPPVKDTCL